MAGNPTAGRATDGKAREDGIRTRRSVNLRNLLVEFVVFSYCVLGVVPYSSLHHRFVLGSRVQFVRVSC